MLKIHNRNIKSKTLPKCLLYIEFASWVISLARWPPGLNNMVVVVVVIFSITFDRKIKEHIEETTKN